MEKQHVLSFLFLLYLLSAIEIQGAQGYYNAHRHLVNASLCGFYPKKMFVFGDSYVDTGNSKKSAVCWKLPYGERFPGQPDGRFSDGLRHPVGRFSDGLVLTDRLAEYFGMESPLPYVMKNARKIARYGINFAFGGTGIFDTLVSAPNMTTQIDFFQNLVNDAAYTKEELQSSMSYVSVSGNDYSSYHAKGGCNQGLPAFVARVVNQMAVNMKRIRDMGVGKVAVGTLQPLGCLPEFTVHNNFQQCNETWNATVTLHNNLLVEAVAKLNSESTDSGAFKILDIYDAFLLVLNNKEATAKFETPILKQCCIAKPGYSCSDVDAKGEKMYTVCDNPEATFFWDTVHPTQAGWDTVFSGLQAKIEKS